MICFNPKLDQNIRLKVLYLPFGDHPKAKFILKFRMLFMSYH
jgi:hypothetical protein